MKFSVKVEERADGLFDLELVGPNGDNVGYVTLDRLTGKIAMELPEKSAVKTAHDQDAYGSYMSIEITNVQQVQE